MSLERENKQLRYELQRVTELYEAGVKSWNPVFKIILDERDKFRAVLETIAAYPSGYKFSGVITDEPSTGKDREEMIHLARSVLK